jgi:hypothetical protein
VVLAGRCDRAERAERYHHGHNQMDIRQKYLQSVAV